MAEPGNTESDASLFERVREGEATAFEVLVRRYYPAAFAVALAVLGTRMDAEDACQDGMVQALSHWERCREPDKIGNWLCQIVRNRARTLVRRRQVRKAESIEAVDPPDHQDTGRQVDRDELGRKLETAMARLSDLQRQVVVLFDLDDWDHRTIAGHLGISEGMSRQHLFQARRELRLRLGRGTLEDYRHG